MVEEAKMLWERLEEEFAGRAVILAREQYEESSSGGCRRGVLGCRRVGTRLPGLVARFTKTKVLPAIICRIGKKKEKFRWRVNGRRGLIATVFAVVVNDRRSGRRRMVEQKSRPGHLRTCAHQVGDSNGPSGH